MSYCPSVTRNLLVNYGTRQVKTGKSNKDYRPTYLLFIKHSQIHLRKMCWGEVTYKLQEKKNLSFVCCVKAFVTQSSKIHFL